MGLRNDLFIPFISFTSITFALNVPRLRLCSINGTFRV